MDGREARHACVTRFLSYDEVLNVAFAWMVMYIFALQDGAYIVKLLDLFDICELDEDKAVLHRIFDIFYALGK